MDETIERANEVTLGNLVDAIPDIVASIISKVGMLQPRVRWSTLGELRG